MINIKPVHKWGAVIGIIFGTISVIILVYLKAQGVFLIILIWMLVPVFIKKAIDRVRAFRNKDKSG